MVAAPWWVRNARVAGDPFFSMRRYWVQMFTGTHPGFALYRSTDTSALGVWAFLAAYPMQFARKVAMALRNLHGAVPGSVGVYIAAFFVAGILHPLQDERARLLRKCLYLALALQVVLAAMQNADVGFVIPLVPLVLAFAVAFFVRLLEGVESRAARGWAVALFLGLAGYPTLVGLAAPGTRPNPSRHNLAALEALLPEKTVVASDAPWAVAWYADRPAVWLPLEPEDFELLQERADIGAVYLTHQLRAWPAQEKPGPWRLMGQAGLRGFVSAWPAQEQGGEVLLIREDIAAGLPSARPIQLPGESAE